VPPRIALFATHLHAGGAERCYVQLAHGLLDCGVEVDAVLVRAEGAMLGQLPDGARRHELGGRTAWAVPRLAAWLRRHRPDALIAFLEQANVAAVLARRLAPAWHGRLALTEHANFDAHRGRAAANLLHRAALTVAPLAYRDADLVIGVSAGVAAGWERRLGPGRCLAIANPAVDDGCAVRAAAPVPHPWYADGAPPLIAVGRLDASKDQATAIAALAEPGMAGERLVIAGDGGERARLVAVAEARGVAERVAFVGHLADPLPWMARSAMLVHAAHYEGFGLVLAEALACGTPVVATDCPHGPAEVLGGGRWGVLVPPQSPAALAAGIRACRDRTWDRAALRARAEDFHRTRIAGRYLQALRCATRPSQESHPSRTA
jgi:glycosyltransferase involved in cell wall biosynthesis